MREPQPRIDPKTVRGLLLDIDGVLHISWQPIPGAPEALRALAEASVPFCLLTNSTTLTRDSLTARLRSIGFAVTADQVITAPTATAAYLRRHHPEAVVDLIVTGDVADEFRAAGVRIADRGEAAGLVVIGGAEDELSYARLNQAFQHLQRGAGLIAMHRNRAWRTAAGLMLDSGPFIRALEDASGVRAKLIGKPSPTFFRQGLRALGLRGPQVLMIGDDAASDLIPAARLGMQTLLVRTGKPVPEDGTLAKITGVTDSIADLPGLLGS